LCIIHDGRERTDTWVFHDSWGRMISKDQGSYDATYEYRYGDKLYSVTSDFPDEGTVTYDYGSDGKRRTRETSTSYSWYNWAGWNVVNEEGSGNVLERTYIHDPGKVVGTILAHSQGTNPSTGTWRYYLQDNIGSTRNLTDDSKVEKGRYWYYPYGDIYSQSGEGIRYKFTGKEWDDDAQMYYFPYRYYSPGIARWISRDPSGMVDGPNLYAYVGANPVNGTDPLGRYVHRRRRVDPGRKASYRLYYDGQGNCYKIVKLVSHCKMRDSSPGVGGADCQDCCNDMWKEDNKKQYISHNSVLTCCYSLCVGDVPEGMRIGRRHIGSPGTSRISWRNISGRHGVKYYRLCKAWVEGLEALPSLVP